MHRLFILALSLTCLVGGAMLATAAPNDLTYRQLDASGVPRERVLTLTANGLLDIGPDARLRIPTALQLREKLDVPSTGDLANGGTIDPEAWRVRLGLNGAADIAVDDLDATAISFGSLTAAPDADVDLTGAGSVFLPSAIALGARELTLGASTTISAYAATLLNDLDASAARATLGLTLGSQVQAWDADLDAWAAKTAPSGAAVGATDTQTLTNKTLTSPVINSPTGIVKSDVGLGDADNTSDADKPVSSAQAAADAAVQAAAAADATDKANLRALKDLSDVEPVLSLPVTRLSMPLSTAQGPTDVPTLGELRAGFPAFADVAAAREYASVGLFNTSGVAAYLTVGSSSSFALGNSSATFFIMADPKGDGWLFTTRAVVGAVTGVGVQVSRSLNQILTRIVDASGVFPSTTAVNVQIPSGPLLIAIVIDRTAGEYRTFLNGTLIETTSMAGMGAINQNRVLEIARTSAANVPMDFYRFAWLDFALTSAQVAEVTRNWTSIHRDEWAGASGATQTSGTLTFGKRYRIATFVSGDDFSNVGATSNATGVEFVAIGTTPTTWTNGSTLQQIGVRCLINTATSSRLQLVDQSGNGLHATPNNADFARLNNAANAKRLNKTSTASNYTLRESDCGAIITVTGNATLTFPDSLSRGWWCKVVNTTTGTTTFSATTFRAPAGATTLTTQFKTVTVYHDGSGIFYAEGL